LMRGLKAGESLVKSVGGCGHVSSYVGRSADESNRVICCSPSTDRKEKQDFFSET
jgi:hypothetical protein